MSLPSVGKSWNICNYRDWMKTKMTKWELYNYENYESGTTTDKKVSTRANEISV